MPGFYLLNQYVQFWPAEHKLVGLREGRFEHVLNVPASRCLELMIERMPQWVPQNDFYEYVWGEEGKAVSVRTLYQNIALLRKGLRAVDSEMESAILTLPKKGFQLSENLSIQYVEEAQPMPTVQTDSQHIHLPPSSAAEVAEPGDDIQPKKTTLAHFSRLGLHYKLAFTYVLLMAMGCAFYGYMKSFQYSTDDFFTQYVPVQQINQCHVYTHKDSDKNAAISVYWLAGKIDCTRKPWIYITLYEFSNFGSVLACDRPFSSHSGAFCDTYTQLNVNYHE